MPKLIFLNVGWMKRYQGLDNDQILGGGRFVEDFRYGHEIYNFLPWQRSLYGYVETPSINIDRLDARPGANSVSGVTAVWIARNPFRGGTYIVGWYENATVYRQARRATFAEDRRIDEYITRDIRAVDEDINTYTHYDVSAAEEDCYLVPSGERDFSVPRGSGGIGQRNIWYADTPGMAGFRRRVLDYIRNRSQPAITTWRKYGRGREGNDHKSLKEWCSNNPQELGIHNALRIPARTEYVFICRDSADVVFEMPDNYYGALEVETTDAMTGAHQSLKYKTLLCAEKGFPVDSDHVKAMLVAWQVPQDVRNFCEKYNIAYYEKRL